MLMSFFAGSSDFDPTDGVDIHASNGQSDVGVTRLTASGGYSWTRTFGGPYDDSPGGVTADKHGSAIVAGGFRGTVDFDPTGGVDKHVAIDDPATATPEFNSFVTKLNADGSYAWTVTFGGGTGDSGANGIACDPEGSLILVGSFTGEVDFDPGDSVELHNTTGASFDAFVTKLDGDGNHIWTRTFGGTATDRGGGIGVDPQGNIFTTGTFRGVADFDPGPGVDNHVQQGLIEDIFLTKLHADGSYDWTRTWPAYFRDSIGRVAVDGDGNAIITGGFEGTVDFDPTDGVDLHTSPAYYASGFVTKMKSDGSYAWTAIFLSAFQTYGDDIAADRAGGVYVTGEFDGVTDFDPGEGIDEHTPQNVDGFVIKLTPSGDADWLRIIGGPSTDFGIGIALGLGDSVHVVGTYQSTVDLNPGCPLEEFASPPFSADYFILKLACNQTSTDFDGDGTVNLRDVSAFQNCFAPNPPTVCPAGCEVLDFNHDDRIDLSDYSSLKNDFAGP